jgi:hypothetical protein
MISCEKCTAWQHNLCMGVTEDEDELERTKYYCEQCRPEEHKDLLEAIKRGEKPWEVRQTQRREEEKSKSKKGKKGARKSGRQSTANDAAEQSSASKASPSNTSPPASAEAGTKRKFEAFDSTNGQHSSTTPTAAASVSQPTPTQDSSAKRSKSVSEAPRRASISTPISKVETIEQLSKERIPVAKALNGELKNLIQKAAKDGSYVLDKSISADALSLRLALDVEHAMHSKYRNNQSAYASQFRAIRFNIKKNEALFKGLLSGSLSPDELAEMSSDDMASEELQKERAAIKEEVDKQVVLAHEEGPRYRKTHKGEELIGDDTNKPSETSYVAPVRRRTIEETHGDALIDTGSPPATELPEGYDEPQISQGESMSPTDRGGQFNIHQVWQSVQPTDPSKASFGQRTNRISRQEDVEMQDVDDPELNRLLKEDDMGGPVSNPDILWRGTVGINHLGSFKATLKYGCGGNIGGIPYSELLHSTLEIDGRISTKTAGDYVAGQRWSNHNDVAGLIIRPQDTDVDQKVFDAVFSYFKDKDRWGVVSAHKHDAIRDLYVIPIDAGTAPMPEFVTMLEQCEIKDPRPTNFLLLTIVARVRQPSGSSQPVSGTNTALGQSPLHPHTPVNQAQPHFSPVVSTPAATFAPADPGTSSLSRQPSPLEIQILGQYISAPVVRQIFESLQEPMNEVQLQNLRDILERDPAARMNILSLNDHIQRRSNEGGSDESGVGGVVVS